MKMGCAAKRGRRGIAGVVAVVIIFAILFSVGTSYMIFQNAQNASYVSNLTAATNKVQGQRAESLSITTFLEGDGDIGFSVNNTSSETVNMTAALVISSTGTLLECDGVGFPAGAGCGNTTPALWATVDASAGSSDYDTGYVYGAGTTDTVKLLTARGNSFSETYPEPAAQAGSTQSVTVNLDNLKWVQLIPQSSSLAQKRYVSNCNAQNCALAYNSQVTAGNILVDAVSWANVAPPSGVPTDTLNDLFTLGASSSAIVSSSPAMVQNRYTSNCNAASCGLAFSSNVASGNTLVYALGWANQSPPSAPTDTRGDSFSVGSSQSVTVNPPATALVQQRYLANCSSATCALAYSSSVTAGNTLVLGLGWPSNKIFNYVPITITNSQSAATPTPFQQMITWDPATYSVYEATNLGNIRFCADIACATPLYAWLESCSNACSSAGSTSTSATAWVQLTTSIAASGVSLTIYMVFNPTSTNFDAVYWGEAPTLTGTYGQFDNGANVFSDYGAFQGSSLPSGWSLSGVASYVGGTSNTGGVRLLSNAGNQYGVATSSKSFSTVGACFDTSAEYNGAADNIGQGFYSSGASTGTGGYNPTTTNANGYYASYEYYTGSKPALLQSSTTLASAGSQTMPTSGTNFLYMETCSTSGKITMQYVTNTGSQYAGGVYSGLTTTVTYTASISAGATTSYIGASTGGSQSYAYLFWDRIRMNPPGGVMPSVSVGSLTGSSFAYVPITITNNQSTATPNPFQQMITWDPATYSTYEATNLGNVRFCADTVCASPLNAWLESCSSTCSSSGSSSTSATAWVKLTSAIGASGGTLTIYMVFGPTTTNFDGVYWGESPSASSIYAQYDNGANVFQFYSDFSGSTLPGSFSTLVSSGTASVNNGLTLSAGSAQYIHVYTTASQNSGVIEANLNSLTSNSEIIVAADTTAPSSGGDIGFQTAYRGQDATAYNDYGIVKDVTGTGSAVTSGGSPSTSGILGLEWSSTGKEKLYMGYVAQLTGADSSISYGSSHLDLFFYGNAATQSASVSWFRNRADPPSGVMPSTSLGSTVIGTGAPTSVSDTLGDTFTLGASQSATNGASTYESGIWYATASSSGANTITATFGTVVAGSVSIYELAGYSTSSPMSSTGSSASGSNTATVTSFTPTTNSIVIGNTETSSASTTFSNGGGYTLVATCNTVEGCSEYKTGSSGSTTVSTNLGTSPSWAESAISFAPLISSTYYSYIWYATAASSGADTISASFGTTVAGSVSIYEINGVTAAGLLSQTGSSSTSQGSTAVTSMTPSSGSVVVGNAETTSTTYTAGSGYTLSGSCGTVMGCGQYQTGVGSATTVPMSISPSGPWVEAAVAFAPVTSTYYSYIWYATAASSGADTITTAFGSTVAASMSIYEITGYTTSGALSSTGSSVSGSTSAAVMSFTPASDSFIVGTTEGASGSTTYTAGSGFALAGTCNSVPGCSEYDAGGGGSANTVPITLSGSTPWAEAAMSFSTPFNPQSGIQVGGYPTMGVPSGASLVWEVTFTNVDSQHRSVTIWPQTELAVGLTGFDGYDIDYIQEHYYIIDGLNPGSTTVNAYKSTTGQYITLAYDVPTTLYFAATQALGSSTQAFGTEVLTPFEAYFAVTGIFSDGSLYGETIPYPYGIITQANAYTTPTAGSTGNTVTVSCTSPCNFSDNTKAMVGWINSAGQLTQLTTFTTTAGGTSPRASPSQCRPPPRATTR